MKGCTVGTAAGFLVGLLVPGASLPLTTLAGLAAGAAVDKAKK